MASVSCFVLVVQQCYPSNRSCTFLFRFIIIVPYCDLSKFILKWLEPTRPPVIIGRSALPRTHQTARLSMEASLPLVAPGCSRSRASYGLDELFSFAPATSHNQRMAENTDLWQITSKRGC